jgi:hypothetical protein
VTQSVAPCPGHGLGVIVDPGASGGRALPAAGRQEVDLCSASLRAHRKANRAVMELARGSYASAHNEGNTLIASSPARERPPGTPARACP